MQMLKRRRRDEKYKKRNLRDGDWNNYLLYGRRRRDERSVHDVYSEGPAATVPR